MAKSLRGRAVVGIIQQTLSSKRVFVFGELLAMPNVEQLRETEHVRFFGKKSVKKGPVLAAAGGLRLRDLLRLPSERGLFVSLLELS